jgi:hypothetical protein
MNSLRFHAFAAGVLTLGLLTLATPAFAAGTTTTSPAQKAFAAYRSCLSAHGVKLPARTQRPGGAGGGGANTGGAPPSTTGGAGSAGAGSAGGAARQGRSFGSGNFVPRNLPKGVTAKKYLAAQKACMSKLPAGGFGGFGGRSTPQFQAYLSCLKDHGVKVPTGSTGLRGLNRNDPAFQAANQICGALLPARPGTAPTTTVPTST